MVQAVAPSVFASPLIGVGKPPAHPISIEGDISGHLERACEGSREFSSRARIGVSGKEPGNATFARCQFRTRTGMPSLPPCLYPLASSNAGLASGSFAMTGSYYGSRVSLQQAHRINQPLGYVMVGLQGQVSAASFTGSVIGPGCSTFRVSRATSYAAPPRVAVEASGVQSKSSLFVY
jgi:hypothetical protein